MKRLVKLVMTQSALGYWLGRLPFISELYARRVWSRRMNFFHGLYDSFEDATRRTSHLSHAGWNDASLTSKLVNGELDESDDRRDWIQTSQYAVMLWLSQLMRPQTTVVDLGGAGGVFFERVRQHGLLPIGYHWHIVDVPDMVSSGKARHARLGSVGISFGSDLGDAPAGDILISLGAIQYFPDPLGESGPGFLDELDTLPDYIIVNKIPLWNKSDVWTTQSFVTTSCPYRIFNRASVLDYLNKHGFRVFHSWQVPELEVRIPFHPECSLDFLEGFLAVRDDLEPVMAARWPRLAAHGAPAHA